MMKNCHILTTTDAAAILMPLASMIKEKYANLEVETYLMAIDGTVEDVKT